MESNEQSIAAPQAPVGAGETVSSHGTAPAGAAPDQPDVCTDPMCSQVWLRHSHPAEQPAVWERPPIVLEPKEQPAAQDGPYISAVPSNEANALVSKIAAQQAEIAELKRQLADALERNHAMSQACDEAHDQFQRAEAERDEMLVALNLGTRLDGESPIATITRLQKEVAERDALKAKHEPS